MNGAASDAAEVVRRFNVQVADEVVGGVAVDDHPRAAGGQDAAQVAGDGDGVAHAMDGVEGADEAVRSST